MKKISIFCAIALVFGLMTGSAFAIQYCKDFDPNGQKSFEDEWTLTQGGTVSFDVYINDVPTPPGTLITGGFWLVVDPSISIVDVQVGDGAAGEIAGPWDSGFTTEVPDASGPGTYMVAVGNFATVAPDADGDIFVGRVTIECLAAGTDNIVVSTIPGFDTVVGDTMVLDGDILPNTVTVHQGNTTKTTTTTVSPTPTTSIGATTTISQTTSIGATTTVSPTTTSIGATTTVSPTPTTSIGASTTTTVPSSDLWAPVYEKMWGVKKEKNLSLLRSLRDEVIAHSGLGKDYIFLLYSNSLEIARLLIQFPSLNVETKRVINELLPAIESFIGGEKIGISGEKVAQIESLFNHFEEKATSPQLKSAIKKVRRDLEEGKLFKPFYIAFIDNYEYGKKLTFK